MICCHCNHLTLFGSGFLVAPNTIDFSYIFANAGFEDNYIIYTTLIVTFSIFIILLIWSRWKDRKDLEKVSRKFPLIIFYIHLFNSAVLSPRLTDIRNVFVTYCFINGLTTKIGFTQIIRNPQNNAIFILVPSGKNYLPNWFFPVEDRIQPTKETRATKRQKSHEFGKFKNR